MMRHIVFVLYMFSVHHFVSLLLNIGVEIKREQFLISIIAGKMVCYSQIWQKSHRLESLWINNMTRSLGLFKSLGQEWVLLSCRLGLCVYCHCMTTLSTSWWFTAIHYGGSNQYMQYSSICWGTSLQSGHSMDVTDGGRRKKPKQCWPNFSFPASISDRFFFLLTIFRFLQPPVLTARCFTKT